MKKLWKGKLKDHRAYNWYDHFVYGYIPLAIKIKYAMLIKSNGMLESL